MQQINLDELGINMLEYCIIDEDKKLPCESVKVKVPKLTMYTKKGKFKPNDSILINDPECKPRVSGMVSLTDTITAKLFSHLIHADSVKKVKVRKCNCIDCNCDCCWMYDYYLVKGAQMIVCFMDDNVNDVYLTMFL